MMMIPGSFEYAQVRLQSRYAARADASAWRAMEHARELSALIEVARRSGFERVFTQLPMPAGLHGLDVAVRKQWHEQVEEVAGWMPPDWQAPVRWCALVVDLPLIQYLAEGGPPYGWMQRDTSLAALSDQARTWANSEAVASGWYRELQGRLPRLSGEDAAHFLVFARAIATHRGAFSSAPADQGWRLRRLLEARLTVLFRRFTLQAPAAFAFLALQWLNLERLRGEVARRLAFPLRGLVP